MQHGWVDASLAATTASYPVVDLLDDVTYTLRGGWNYVRFDPGVRQGHVMQIGT